MGKPGEHVLHTKTYEEGERVQPKRLSLGKQSSLLYFQSVSAILVPCRRVGIRNAEGEPLRHPSSPLSHAAPRIPEATRVATVWESAVWPLLRAGASA